MVLPAWAGCYDMNPAPLLRPVTVFLLALVFLASVPPAAARSPKWEYLVVNATMKNPNLQRMLDARGAEGWELVAFTRKDVAVFKRTSR